MFNLKIRFFKNVFIVLFDYKINKCRQQIFLTIQKCIIKKVPIIQLNVEVYIKWKASYNS